MIRALLVLMLGAFVSQTTEYLPIGLLPRIAEDLQVFQAAVGALVTGYAWIITLTVIPIMLLTNRINRRPLFLALLANITLCNGLALVAHSYWFLILLRIIAALGHGVFWSILASYAVKIAPRMPPGRATAWAYSGISLSIVGGVPLSTAELGHRAGAGSGRGGIGAVCNDVQYRHWRRRDVGRIVDGALRPKSIVAGGGGVGHCCPVQLYAARLFTKAAEGLFPEPFGAPLKAGTFERLFPDL